MTDAGDEMVPGTCASVTEYWYWLVGAENCEYPVQHVDESFCMDGDDEGCAALRDAGRCPYSEYQYARIVRKRQLQTEANVKRSRKQRQPV